MSSIKPKFMHILFLVVICSLSIPLSVVAADKKASNGNEDIAAVLAQELKLDEQQTQKVRTEMNRFGAQLEKLFEEQEAEDADPEKLIGGVKQAQDTHNKELQKILSKDQFIAYEALKEKAIKGIFTDLVAIQLMDIQPKTSISNEQIDKLAPVLADTKYKIIKIVWENAGKKLRPRQKISLGRQLKSIQGETRAAVEKILTPEQLEAWDKYKEEQQQKKG